MDERISSDDLKPDTSRSIVEDFNLIQQKRIKIQTVVAKQHSIILTLTRLKQQLEENKRRLQIMQMKIEEEENVNNLSQAIGKSLKGKLKES